MPSAMRVRLYSSTEDSLELHRTAVSSFEPVKELLPLSDCKNQES